MMLAFQDDIYHFQEILEYRTQAAALLARLRVKRHQCAAAPSVKKSESLPAGVLTAARKTINVQMPCGYNEGLANDLRCAWSRLRLAGWEGTILMCNVYCKCGLGLKDQNLDYTRVIAEATDLGRCCLLAFAD